MALSGKVCENAMTLRELSQKITLISPERWAVIAKAVGLNVRMDDALTADQCQLLLDAGKRYWKMQQKKQEAAEPDPEPEELRGYSVNNIEMDNAAPSDKEAQAIKSMDTMVQERRIFIDQTSLLAPQSLKALPNLIQVLKKHRRKVYLPESVVNALNRAAQEDQDQERKKIAQNSVRLLRDLQREGLLDVRKSVSENSTSAMDIYQSCSYFRLNYPLMVITQDADLTRDLITLNRQESARGNNIFVKKFNKYGYLSNVIDPPPKPQKQPKNTCPTGPNNRRSFLRATQVRQEPDRLLDVTVLPGEGDLVYTDPECRGSIRLESQRAEGGEGCIFTTNTPYVAKIYKKTHVTAYRQEKVTKMVQAGLEYPGICFPMNVLYNRCGEFVGYLMQEAKGVNLQNCMRMAKISRHFPDWNRKDLAQLALTILYKINYIHGKGLLIGDINENNIMVVSPTEVYMVDTDSYQVNDLPCQVAVELFVAPELLDRQAKGEYKEFAEILRTPQNENFAVATLMFLILMQGKPPYSHANGGSMVQNIMKMHFPYADGAKGSDGAPEGIWRFIWSHLGYNIKQAFQKCFNKDKGTSPFNMKDRLTAEGWMIEMNRYHEFLCKVEGELAAYKQKIAAGVIDPTVVPPPEDEQDLWLYPKRLKWRRTEGQYNLRRCVRCGEWACVTQLREGWCPECREVGEEAVCSECGEEFIYPEFEKCFGKNRGEIICRDCHKKRQKNRQVLNEIVYNGPCKRPGCCNTAKITKWMDEEDMKNFGEVFLWCPDCRRLFLPAKNRRNGNRNYGGTPPQRDAQPKNAAAATPVQRPVTPAQQRPAASAQSRPTAPSKQSDTQFNSLYSKYGQPGSSGQKPAATQTRPAAPSQRPTTQTRPQTSPAPKPDPKKSSGSSGCFITTAVCDYLGKPDDCQELMDFRRFRDNWLRHQPGGEDLVREYYETAPELVRRMHASDAYADICTEIWKDYLLPCQQMIHENRLEDCRDHYVAMVRHLQARVGCK